MLTKLFGISFGLGVLALVAAKATANMSTSDAAPRDPAKLLEAAINILPPSLTPSQWHAAIDELELEIARHANTIQVPYLVYCVTDYVRRDEKKIYGIG